MKPGSRGMTSRPQDSFHNSLFDSGVISGGKEAEDRSDLSLSLRLGSGGGTAIIKDEDGPESSIHDCHRQTSHFILRFSLSYLCHFQN